MRQEGKLWLSFIFFDLHPKDVNLIGEDYFLERRNMNGLYRPDKECGP